jgi:protein phosphatase
MLARLRGMVQSLKPGDADTSGELLPTWDAAPTEGTFSEPPAAAPVATPLVEVDQESSLRPLDQTPEMMEPPFPGAQPKCDLDTGEKAAPIATPSVEEPTPVPAAETAPPTDIALCPACQTPYAREQAYCNDCGYIFPPEIRQAREAHQATEPKSTAQRLKGRYEITTSLGERGGVARFHGVDYPDGSTTGIPVQIIRAALPIVDSPSTPTEASDAGEAESEDALPTVESPPGIADTATFALPASAPWPSVEWERDLIAQVNLPALPALLDCFTEDGNEYLIEEIPTGRLLWDAWDDPEANAAERFGWLKQIAETLHALHQHGAMLETLRPDIVVVSPEGQARVTDLSDLLPLPLPADAAVRASLYTAPELVAGAANVDARADLFSFGAMLYALHVGRELAELDFEGQGRTPKPFIPRFPDVHPLFGRLVTKTFQRDLPQRFPTDEAHKEDATGFIELIRTLEVCRRTLDNVRLEIASWTTTGIVRTGNEDAFALIHTVESRQDDLEDAALVLLADGMGGYEAGEVAAALAVQALRKYLLQQPAFHFLAGESPFSAEFGADVESFAATLDTELCKRLLSDALRDANKQVYTASRSGIGKRGMGCTAEAVFINGRHVVVGHVGDSRTYHFHEGRLIQLTRDHTLVNRLVEIGTLTAEEAEHHPRRNELQQAIGGQPHVEPGLYSGRMKPGDWVVVCSDGVSNHVTPAMLKEMLESEATSAEMAARRLVNLVNIEGATDNATVVVVRAT